MCAERYGYQYVVGAGIPSARQVDLQYQTKAKDEWPTGKREDTCLTANPAAGPLASEMSTVMTHNNSSEELVKAMKTRMVMVMSED